MTYRADDQHAASRRGRADFARDTRIEGELKAALMALMYPPVGQQTPKDVFETIVRMGIDAFDRHVASANQEAAAAADCADDPQDALIAIKAQQSAYAQLNEAYGYTPLTTHHVTGGGTATIASPAGNKKKPSKQRQAQPQAPGQGNRKRKNRRRRTQSASGR